MFKKNNPQSLWWDSVLERLPSGAEVAVVTMQGSLCPVTLGHVRCFREARAVIMDAARSKAPSGTDFAEYVQKPGYYCDSNCCLAMPMTHAPHYCIPSVTPLRCMFHSTSYPNKRKVHWNNQFEWRFSHYSKVESEGPRSHPLGRSEDAGDQSNS